LSSNDARICRFNLFMRQQQVVEPKELSKWLPHGPPVSSFVLVVMRSGKRTTDVPVINIVHAMFSSNARLGSRLPLP
jgi:hypothetical protein